MTIFTNLDNTHEGPQWWSEIVDREGSCRYSSTWYETEVEAWEDAARWLRTQRKLARQRRKK